jgi:hypothetical protein
MKLSGEEEQLAVRSVHANRVTSSLFRVSLLWIAGMDDINSSAGNLQLGARQRSSTQLFYLSIYWLVGFHFPE